MEGLCSIGQQENAECCCACKFPLPRLCEKHVEEHKSKDPGNHHFTLPLSAVLAIPSKQVLSQAWEWLIRLNFNITALREKCEEISGCEELIEAVYQELQHHTLAAKMRLQEKLSVVKRAFSAAVEVAVKEVSTHALDIEPRFVPVDILSDLLWSHDSGFISAFQFYTFQANSAPALLESAFQIALRFTLSGFEHLKVGQSTQFPSAREEELLKEMALKDETHSREIDTLRKEVESARVREQQAENKIQELRAQLEAAQTELQHLHRAAEDQRSIHMQTEEAKARDKKAPGTMSINPLSSGKPAVLEPSGELISPVSSCQVLTKLVIKKSIQYLLGTEMNPLSQRFEEATDNDKCQRCGISCSPKFFLLLSYCGCKVCAYCQIELMKTNKGVCICGDKFHNTAVQLVSTLTEKCQVCKSTLYLNQEFTPVRCEGHILCAKCLAKAMKTSEPRCQCCHRLFATFEIKKAEPFFVKQCAFCGRYFDQSEALDLPCHCNYCEQCATACVMNGYDIKRCFICKEESPQELVKRWEYLLFTHYCIVVAEFVVTIKAEKCRMCLNPIGVKQKFTLECGHSFHRICLNDYAENFLSCEIQGEIKCPNAQCGAVISANKLQKFMKPKDFLKYTEALRYL